MNDSAPTDIPVKTINILQVADDRLASSMRSFSRRLAVYNAGYSRRSGRYSAVEFPQISVERATIYRGQKDTWAYSHHIAITKFGKRYVASWSNGIQNEDHFGQEVHYAWSHDARTWSDPQVVVSTSIESGVVRNNAGLYADGERLYCYVGLAKDALGQRDSPHMHHFKNRHIQLDVYETTDLEHWTAHERICDDVYLFEGPRLTQSGRLMVCGFDWPGDHHAMVLLWDASQPTAEPRVVHLPIASLGIVPEQGSWFQTDDGRIWMYQRDGTTSCRLGLSWSDDDGETWSEMYRTNFQNTYSRTYAGRLSDGRFYIVGNNHELFLERRHLHLALSDDGRCFNRQYTLVTGDTTRRVEGNNKEDGYHYPSCCIDGDRLLVIYSVNKEDIEVASVDMSKVD